MAVDRTKFLETIKQIRHSINELSVYGLDVYTAIELYYILATKQNEVINELNRFEEVTDIGFDYLLNDGVVVEVRKKLDELNANGELTQIIEQQVVPDLYNKLNNARMKVNVRDYGAVGDGKTDDTQAIKQALAECGSPWEGKPSILYFPHGNYKMTEGILITKSYISIEGEDYSNTNLIFKGTFNAIELRGTQKSQLWGNSIKRISVDCTGLTGNGIQTHRTGLEFRMEDVYVIGATGKGIYMKSPYDCLFRNINVRNCTDVGIHLDEVTTDEDGWLEMSYVTMERCTVVNCGRELGNKIQYLITGGNNIFFNDCKANEGYIGILFNDNTWNARINNFYMDGLEGTAGDGNYARAFVVDGSGTNDLTLSNVYTWNCGHILHVKQAASISCSNLTRNKWGTYGTGKEMIKIEDTFDGKLLLDGKHYTVSASEQQRLHYYSPLQIQGQCAIDCFVKEVTREFYSGGNKIAWEYTGYKTIIYATAEITSSKNKMRCKTGNVCHLTPHVQFDGGYAVCYLELPDGEIADETANITVRFFIVAENDKRGDY